MKNNSPVGAALWSFIETFSTQFVGLIIGIILARLLTPTDYGTVALISIFIAISTVLIDSGFSNAIIRKIDRTDEDLNTAFYFNIGVSVFCYILLFILAPYISAFFSVTILTILIRIIGLDLIINALCSVQNALLISQLNIRRQTLISISSSIPAGLLGIILAYLGWGVYALVFQTLIGSFMRAVILWSKTNWYPNRNISKKSFVYLWGFGSKLVLANIIGTIFERIYSVIIGKYYSVKDLGYYGKSSNLNDQSHALTNGILSKIALPILARNQNNVELLKNDFCEMMRLMMLILSPITAFLYFESDNIILFLYTDKWIQSALYFRLLLIGTIWMPISHLSQTIMHVVNRTDIILKLEIPKKILYVVYIFIGLKFGIVGLCYAQILINLSAAIINMIPAYYFLKFNYFVQIFDIAKYVFYAFLFGFLTQLLPSSNFIVFDLFISLLFFSCLYFSCLYLIKDEVALKYYKRLFNYFPILNKK